MALQLQRARGSKYHVAALDSDPGMFATTLNREYKLAAEAFALSESTLADIAANGVR